MEALAAVEALADVVESADVVAAEAAEDSEDVVGDGEGGEDAGVDVEDGEDAAVDAAAAMMVHAAEESDVDQDTM